MNYVKCCVPEIPLKSYSTPTLPTDCKKLSTYSQHLLPEGEGLGGGELEFTMRLISGTQH